MVCKRGDTETLGRQFIENALPDYANEISETIPASFEPSPGIDASTLDLTLFTYSCLTDSSTCGNTLHRLSSALQVETAETKVLATSS